MTDGKPNLSAEDYAYTVLLSYVCLLWPDYQIAKYHHLIAQALQAVEKGKLTRLMIFCPPRSGKTMLVSEYFPAWYLGRNPQDQIIYSTYSHDRGTDVGRKVRNQMIDPIYNQIFPYCQISPDSKGANKLSTLQGGNYYSVGVGGAITGRGANVLLIDDPIKGQEDADSALSRRRLVDWFDSVAYTRLMPKNAIILVMCVAEDEKVLMSDGTWTPIQNIQIGDFVIGYENGRPVPKKVLRASSCGEDEIVEVVSRSCSLRVNKRHPFLVIKGGLKKSAQTQNDIVDSRKWNLEWVCAGDLKPGDSVVTIKKLLGGNYHRPTSFKKPEIMNQDDYWLFGFLFGDGWIINNGDRGIVGFCVADSVYPELNNKVQEIISARLDIKMKPTKHGYHRADGRPQARWLASMGLTSGAHSKRLPEWVFKLRPCDKRQFLYGFFSADGYERPKDSFMVNLCNKELLNDLRLLARTCGFKTTKIYESSKISQPPNSPIAKEFHNYAARFYCKYNKIELSKRYGRQEDLGRFFRIEDVEAIKPAGRKTVYDLTVEGAESFVAEGFVVHNTRWHFDDLAGYLLREKQSENWTVINLPAMAESDNDMLGRKEGDPLWPESFPKSRLNQIKATVQTRTWNALYQQRPLPAEGGMINLNDFKRFSYHEFQEIEWNLKKKNIKPPKNSPLNFKRIIMSWDTAFKEDELDDPSACSVWGQNDLDDIYLLHVLNKKLDYPKLRRAVIEIWDREQKLYKFPTSKLPVLIEDRASGQSLIQDLKSSTRIAVIPRPTKNRSKQFRMSEGSALVEAGKVYLPDKGPAWLVDAETQLAQFPHGARDDIADSFSQVWTWIGKPRYKKSAFPKFWK